MEISKVSITKLVDHSETNKCENFYYLKFQCVNGMITFHIHHDTHTLNL